MLKNSKKQSKFSETAQNYVKLSTNRKKCSKIVKNSEKRRYDRKNVEKL